MLFERINFENPIVLSAFEAADLYHLGQTDKAGKPYILHPLAVANMLTGVDKQVVALLHDVMEDTDATEEDLKTAGVTDRQLAALRLLVHKDDVAYDDYLRNLKKNPLAVAVKRADVFHNGDPERLASLPEAEQLRLRKKYEHALKVLGE